VASLVEFPLNNDERLSVACKPLGPHFVSREYLVKEVIDIRCPSVGQRVELYHWIFVELYDLKVGRSRWSVSP
jgi:hypothetical protein